MLQQNYVKLPVQNWKLELWLCVSVPLKEMKVLKWFPELVVEKWMPKSMEASLVCKWLKPLFNSNIRIRVFSWILNFHRFQGPNSSVTQGNMARPRRQSLASTEDNPFPKLTFLWKEDSTYSQQTAKQQHPRCLSWAKEDRKNFVVGASVCLWQGYNEKQVGVLYMMQLWMWLFEQNCLDYDTIQSDKCDSS